MKEVRSGSARNSGTVEVDSPVEEPHVEQVLAEPQRGRGVVDSKVCQASSGSHRGSIDR